MTRKLMGIGWALGLGISLAILLITRSALAGGPWYVTPGGSDAADCISSVTACATINGAIQKAAAGDVIYVAAGTYTNATDSQVVLIDKSVTISGGWDGGFSAQMGMSIVDGQQTRMGITVNGGVTVTATRFIVQDCWGGTGTAGIFNKGALTLNQSVVRNNTSANSGAGGIRNDAMLTLNDSAVTGNRSYRAAGIDNNGTLVMNNTTVSGNVGDCLGSGILNDAQLTLNNSAIIDNRGTEGYFGGLYSELVVQNSIIAGNTTPDMACPNGARDFASLGYNLVGTVANLAACRWTPAIGDRLGIDPGVGPLEGLPPYHPLLPGSPALDAGNPAGCMGSAGLLAADQRGFPRLGRCDIGPYEAPPLAHTQLEANAPPVYPGSVVTYTLVLTNGSPNPIANVTVTDTLPEGLAFGGLLSATSGAVQFDGSTVSWQGTVDAGQQITLTLNAIISQTAQIGASITNTAVVQSDTESYTLSATVTPLQPLTAALSVDHAVGFRGQPLAYTLTLGNLSLSDIQGITLTSPLPDALLFSGQLDASSGSPSYANGVIQWGGTVHPGEVVTCTFGVTVSQSAPLGASVTVTTNIQSDGEFFTRAVSVTLQSAATAALTVDRLTVDPGTPLTFTLAITNNSYSPLPSVAVTNPLPSLLNYTGPLTASSGSGSYNPRTVLWTGPIDAGDSVTMTYQAKISSQAWGGPVITNTAAISAGFEVMTRSATVAVNLAWPKVFLPLCLRSCTDFFDDFSNPASGWFVGDTGLLAARYQSGHYRVETRPANALFYLFAPACRSENYIVELDGNYDASLPGVAHGLIFGRNANDQYYLFLFDEFYPAYTLLRHDPTGWTILQPWSQGGVVPPVTVNHLKVIRYGAQIQLEVNGSHLGAWTDGTITGLTRTGLVVWPDAYSYAYWMFDNFRLTLLPGLTAFGQLPASSQPAVSADFSGEQDGVDYAQAPNDLPGQPR